MRVVIILGIPLVIVTTVTLLCIPSYLQQVITDILVPADSLQGTTDVLLTTTVYNRGKLFAVTIPNSTATTMADVAKNQADNLPAIDSGPTTSGGDSAVRLPPTPLHATSRSLISDNTILPQDDNFVVKPSAPLRLVIGDNMTYVNPRSIDRYGKNNMTTDETDIDTRINQTNERQVIMHRQLNHDNYMNVKVAKSVAEEDVSSGYQTSHDKNYNIDDYSYKEPEYPAAGTEWTKDQWSGTTGMGNSWDRPAYEFENYRPSVRPLPSNPSKPHKPDTEVNKELKINWQKFGILALIKLGLAKLQAIGFFKTVFLILVKFKLYMVAVFVKFILVLKLIKSFNILLLPFFFFKFLPTMINLYYNMMGQMNRIPEMHHIRNQVDRYSHLPSSQEVVQRPGGIYYRPQTRPPSVITNRIPGQTVSTVNGINTPGGTLLPTLRLDDLLNSQPNSALELYDPTFGLYQKVLESEKCVERIACRIAAAEKTGMMPIWINWIVHRVTKLIPNNKLEAYLKTYKDVHDEFYNNSMTPDNWETWCSEHYECNGDVVSNNMPDTYQ